MRTIIAGGREFKTFDMAFSELDEIHKSSPLTKVYCGMALHWLWKTDPTIGGADRAGYEWAKSRGVTIVEFCANWHLGRSAGMIRNREMADKAERAIVFWDGKSKGSKNMIDVMKRLKKQVIIVPY